jgi:hypothetical protein
MTRRARMPWLPQESGGALRLYERPGCLSITVAVGCPALGLTGVQRGEDR